MKKPFSVYYTHRNYWGEPTYTPKLYGRFNTFQEAEECAQELNAKHSRDIREALYKSMYTKPIYEKLKFKAFYTTYEAKETTK